MTAAATSGAYEKFVGGLAQRAASTESLRDALRQGEVWTDQLGRVHAVAAMEPRYAANVARFLVRQARRLHDGECAAWFFLPEPHGEQAAWDVQDEVNRLHEIDPEEWVRRQPLVRALVARADGHQGGPSRRWLLRHPVLAARRALR